MVIEESIGQDLHQLMSDLFPICRSITGEGVRETLRIIGQHIPLRIHEVPSGTQAFDWTVPKEWNIRDAFIKDEHGNRIVDFQENNLHVVGYSSPVDGWMSLAELNKHVHSLEEQPDAIPYVTSYYREHWGFCLTHNKRRMLEEGRYRVVIDSEIADGHLTYGELMIPGERDEEVFLSTYICHPSMANNELSGPVVMTFLAKWIMSQPRSYTYRIIFIPETIGSIVYLSRNFEIMKRNVIVGFNLSCLGDERTWSFVESRYGNTLAEKVVINLLSWMHPDFRRYSFLERGSDERQYCSPGVDLPVVTLCRTKFGQYPEYHTSLDNLDLVTPDGLEQSYRFVKACLELVERNRRFNVQCMGEPQLGKRGLYPTLSTKKSGEAVRSMMNLLAYSDGNNDLVDISNLIKMPVWELYPIVDSLRKAGLLEECS